MDLIGTELLWQVALRANDAQVFKSSVEFLIKLHTKALRLSLYTNCLLHCGLYLRLLCV
jgi:hypothetical protein